MPPRLLLAVLLGLLLCSSAAFAAGAAKPYLHKAELPKVPEVRLFGQYATQLFPGSATYTYTLDMPKGVGGLQPVVFISYNSQSAKQRPGILGAGWSLNQDLVYRDVNGTLDNMSDDKYFLVLDNNLYELKYAGGSWHAEVDYWFKIENLSSYWLVTKQDGTQYRFGYNADSEVASNTGRSYSLKWLLDQVEDTHSNKLFYTYAQNSNAEDSGAAYLTQITYNSDELRAVNFTYESAVRPDRRRVYDQGNLFEESRRLSNITITVDDSLVRRHDFNYTSLSAPISSLASITQYGADSVSALFTISLSYYPYTSSFLNSSSWRAPIAFTNTAELDYGARLLDVNNDGFADIVQRRQSNENVAWLNDKLGNWSNSTAWKSPVDIVSSTGADLGVRFDDVNRDGLLDVLSAKASSRAVYLNNGSGWALSSWTLPADFVDSSNVDQGLQLSDVNGDGFVDLISARASSRTVYLSNGSNWSASSLAFPTDFVDASGVDQGTRLVDVNADGLVDVLQSENVGTTSQGAWLNNGSGWNNSSTWSLPSGVYFTETSKADAGIRLVDLDGDGLTDLTQYYVSGGTNTTNAWLNNGTGWTQNSSWLLPDAVTKNNNNTGRRLADVNGDGFVDFVLAEATQNTWLKSTSTPYLLRAITNEYGGVTSINYATSTQFNNTEDGVSRIGFNIFVVANVSKNNSLSGLFGVLGNVSYNYSLGKYNYNTSEFRGFGLTTETMPTSVVQHSFYQDDARRGKEYRTSVYGTDGTRFSMAERDWNYTYESGVYNLSLRSVTNYQYDELDEPVVTNTSYQYNLYGNPQYVTEHGDVDISGDERYTNYSYGFNTVDWIINKVSRKTVYDANVSKASEIKYYYDALGLNGVGSLGELTKTEQWSSDGNNTYTYFDYDSYGNLIHKTDSLGNLYTYRYDSLNVFVESIINPLGHITTFAYDAGTGNLLSSTQNGITTNYTYDTFGRVIKEIRPYDTAELPTKSYNYSFDGIAPEKIIVRAKTTANNTENVAFFYDGFGNIVQLKQALEGGVEDVKNVFYDTEFRVGGEQNQYFDNYSVNLSTPSSSVNYTNYTYDALSRVVYVRNPDGTNKTTSFSQYNITDYDENGHRHVYTLDALGRIVSVFEFNNNSIGGEETYTTSYGYDANDNLLTIVDNEDNSFNFSYDSLSRKTRMQDPDMGTWTYKYDTNSNLVNQTDARSKSIALLYDGLNRVTAKRSDDVNVSFGYDGQYYGTLSNVSATGSAALTGLYYNFSYDERLRVTNSTKNIAGSTFTQTFLYDSIDRLVSRNSLDYIYNLQGKVDQIPGYINDSNYNPFGSLANRTYSNGKIATYTYSTTNNRLLTITIPSVQNLTYTYDSVGNILSITDGVANKVSAMTYDDLDRLLNATIGADRYVYDYNSIGNIMKIVKNNESKKFVYDGLAHAPSTVIEGGSGVDVVYPHELYTNSKDRVIEFSLANDRNETTPANFSVSFGDNSNINSTTMVNLSSASVVVLVEKNYSYGGDYNVTVNATANGSVDRESEVIKFGTRAQSLGIVYTNISLKYIEFIIQNDVRENVSNISWSCSNGLGSIYLINLTGNATVDDILQYNYTSAGGKTFTCNATSLDGNESLTITFDIPSLSIEEYDVLYTNASYRIVAFEAKNYYYDLLANVTTVTNGGSASQSANITNGDELFVVTATNYTSDGLKNFGIALSGNGTSTAYNDSFTLQGVALENYVRVENNLTSQILLFDVVNQWNTGAVNWSISNPSVPGTGPVTNSTTLAQDARVAIIISNTYAQQDTQQAVITANVSVFTPKITDLFGVHPLEIVHMQTLYESYPSAAVEMRVRNNWNTSQVFSWRLTGPTITVTSTNNTNITDDDAFIIVYSGYNTGATETTGFVNSTTYNDTANGVVVVT